MRDRLRAVNCPVDMIDQIGGWRKKSVGEGYGEGYDLDCFKSSGTVNSCTVIGSFHLEFSYLP